MKFSTTVFVFALLCPTLLFAQPMYSPGIRADRETTWMKDSLHLPEAKLNKVHEISLLYNQRMDSVSETSNKNKEKIKTKLSTKKDADIRSLLTRQQYQKYYRREQMIREREKIVYPKGRQPN